MNKGFIRGVVSGLGAGRGLVVSATVLVVLAGGVAFLSQRGQVARSALRSSPADSTAAKQSQSPSKSIVASSSSVGISNQPITTTSASRPAEFVNFSEWTQRFQNSSSAVRLAMVDEGVELAKTRRAVMKNLIRTNPEQAISLAVSQAERQNLPEAVVVLLEKRVSGIGNYLVECLVSVPGQPEEDQVRRSVAVDGTNFFAYVYGQMMHEHSVDHMPIEGVAVDDQLALMNTSSYGGLAWGESSIGSSTLSGRPDMPWTHGTKKILLVRVDFSDLPGEPVIPFTTNVITTNYLVDLFTGTNGISDYYRQSSYGKTDISIDVTPVIRVPNTAVYYAQGDGSIDYSGQIRDAALGILSTNYNYDLSQYDRLGVICAGLNTIPNSKMTYAGVAGIYNKNFLINGYCSFSVVAHEIGHTYGVWHANWWKPSNNTTVGTEANMKANLDNGEITGVSLEYGDRFDIMGGQSDDTLDARFQFNHMFKNVLGWIPDASVQSVTNSGIYRVYRFDAADANYTNSTMALKINRDIIRDYWIGYRRQITNGCNIANGAYIVYGYHFNRNSELLDCNNPGVNVDNAALQVGQSLVDTNAGITITTLAQGGTAPNEYLDIQVTMQPRVSVTNTLAVFETTTNAATVTVFRTGGSNGVTTVDYASVDGTAISGTHYTGSSGTLTWQPGDMTPRTLVFPMTNYPASWGETRFNLVLTNIVNGVLINPSATTVALRPPGGCDNAYFADIMGGYGGGGIASMEVQPDGTMLVSGYFSSVGRGGGTNSQNLGHFGRLLSNGSRDYTFNSGIGVTELYAGVEVIRRQPDGKIIIGGGFHNVNNLSPAIPYLARLNSDGSLDTTFHPPTLNNPVHRVAVQPDGRIVVVGGFRTVNGQPCLGLCRLLQDGSVDFLFNGNYYMGWDIFDVALDNYGASNEVRIVVAGGFESKVYPYPWIGAIRLNADGTEDTSFHAPSFTDAPQSMALQSDGKILLGGTNMTRLNPDGALDATFSTIFTSVNGPVFIRAILPQPDGNIVVGGNFATVNGVANKDLIRLTSTGALDPTWDNGTGSYNGSYQWVYALALRPDGRIVVGCPALGGIRGAGAQEGVFAANVYGVTSQALYSGITNRYGLGQFTVANYAAGPGGTATFTVQRINGSSGAVALDYATQNGTAIAGSDFVAAQGTLYWADGDSSEKTVTVNCKPTAIAGRTFYLNLGIPRGGIQLGMINRASVTLQSGYSVWAAQNFTPQQLTNSAISSITATPAGDGVANLLKYALGLSPFTPSATNMPVVTIVNDRLQMVFNRNPLATDLTYEVQASSNLNTGIWTPLARSFGGSPTTNVNAFTVFELPNGSLFNVTVQDTNTVSTTPARFFRLEVSQ